MNLEFLKEKTFTYDYISLYNGIYLFIILFGRAIMPKPPDISLQDVAKACEQIKRLEQRPTVDRVYAILNKGSRTTINKFLREYLRRTDEKNKIQKIDCPPASLMKLQEAILISNKERDETIKKLEEVVMDKEKYIQEILKESEDLESNHNVLKNQINAALMRNKELEGNFKKLQEENMSFKKDMKSLQDFKEKFIAQKSRNDTIAEQVNDYKKRIKELEAENRTLLERAIKAEK